MKDRKAIDIVLRAAEANARGHEDCAKILRAIERVKEILAIAQKKK